VTPPSVSLDELARDPAKAATLPADELARLLPQACIEGIIV